MTVSSSTNKVSFNGDGSTTVFAYSFKVFDESDLTVILRASDGTETTQTITTNYTVSGVGDAGGGNVTMVTAPASGEQLTILREQPLTQGLDLVPNDPFPANSIEDSLDKLTFMVQQQQEELDRSIKASKTTTISTVEFVESAATRANKVFAFDGSGDLDLTQEIGTFQGDWAASTAYAVRDIVKDTNNNNIYIANTAHTSSGTVPLSSNADIAKWDLLVDAAAATTSANNAATSATAAATSATAAATSATAAATSESNAATSASNASTSETNAAASATNAATSESNAAGSESAAATSESNAATSATNASTSASAAATSATNAATSETAAAASQAAAATSETNAATSATSAATNATNAATSASNASTAQTAAETAQTAAEAAQAAAELAADNFDDTYLGSKSSDPTVDNDGGALNAGDLYFNTTSNTLKVYSGSAWQDAAVDSSGFVQTTGDTMTGNLSFGDNDKAIFGAGSDLQIYHDGSYSRIHDEGTGSLILQTNGTNVSINSTGKNMGIFTKDGSVDLYYDGVKKLATTSTGVDITGTLTSDGLTVDTNTLHVDSTNNRVGISTSSPDVKFHVSGGNARIAGTEASGSFIDINASNTGSDGATLGVSYYGSGSYGPLKFSVGGSERMRIDNNGNVGIGTSSPSATLTVSQGANNIFAVERTGVGSGSGQFGINIESDSQTTMSYDDGAPLVIGTASNPSTHVGFSERMRIDSSGNVGIGTSSPVTGTGVTSLTIYDTSPYIYLQNPTSGTSASDGFSVILSGSDAYINNRENGNMIFYNSNTERMRIDSDGRANFNTTAALGTGVLQVKLAGTNKALGIRMRAEAAGNWGHAFENSSGTIIGNIVLNASSTSYNTTSDYRLKENVTDVTDGIIRVKQLAPKRFNFIADPDTTVDGFIAHEAQAVVPEAVTGTHNEVDDDGNAVMQGIDQSKLVPLLTAALQEAIAKIETLETEMTSVKARLDALEA